jgi:hypothetical protein
VDPDPHGSAFLLFSWIRIQIQDPGFGIRKKLIPDPGVKKAPDLGSATLTLFYRMEFSQDELKGLDSEGRCVITKHRIINTPGEKVPRFLNRL